MRYSTIDVGSNTIRMVIGDVENGKFTEIAHDRDFASLINYVNDGILSDEGRTKITQTLLKMKDLSQKNNTDKIFCFATASLRAVKNIDEVIYEIKEKTGINMEIISGEDEAKYDFYGLMSDISDDYGFGFDLGGGSAQLFAFTGRKLDFYRSYKIGGQVIYKNFVHEGFPDAEKMQEIYDYILKTLSEDAEHFKKGTDRVFALGGAVRNSAKYFVITRKLDKNLDGFVLKRDDLVKICQEIALTDAGKSLLKKHFPDRVTTLVPGIITTIAIIDFLKADKIQVVLKGVREGFLYDRVLKKG